MSFLATLASNVLPAVASGVVGNMFGGGQSQQASGGPAQGVQSAMAGPQNGSGPLLENPSGGSQWKTLLNQGIQAGIQGVTNKYGMQQQGQNQRAYLNEMFPEANPWDLMGVSGNASATAGQQNQQSVVDKQLKTQKEMQDKQLDFQREQLRVQEALGYSQQENQLTAAGITTAPANAMVPFQQALSTAQEELAQLERIIRGDQNQRQELSSFRNIMDDYLNADSDFERTRLQRSMMAIAAENAGNALGNGLRGVTGLLTGGRRPNTNGVQGARNSPPMNNGNSSSTQSWFDRKFPGQGYGRN